MALTQKEKDARRTNKQVQIRLSPDEMEAIDKALPAGVTRPEWIKQKAVAAAKRAARSP